MSGFFIVFEGVDGAGKTTQIKLLYSKLIENGYGVVRTLEPGGTSAGQTIRNLVFHNEIDPVTEVFLFAADRAEHVRKVIAPALNDGKVVISDRFVLSSIVYQGYGKGLGGEFVEEINKHALDGVSPDLTIILDIPVDKALKRVQNANRFENRELQDKVRVGFLTEANKNKTKIVLIESDNEPETISRLVWEEVSQRLEGGTK
jgi:dTMP kinase